MSYGSIKTGPDQYLDLQTNEAASREWFAEQEPVDLGHFAGYEFPEEIRNGVNKIIGELLADILDASFVSRTVLKTVHVDLDQGPRESLHKFPGGSTLPLDRLASVIHNRSGDVVRQLINLSDDEELKKQAEGIKPAEDKVPSVSGLFFSDEYFKGQREEVIPGSEICRTNAFDNNRLLNQEATELLNLLEDGVVEAVRDYVGIIAEEILRAARFSYQGLYYGAEKLLDGIEDGEIDEDVEYSTLSPERLKEVLKDKVKLPILRLISVLPKEEADNFFRRIYGFEPPENREET